MIAYGAQPTALFQLESGVSGLKSAFGVLDSAAKCHSFLGFQNLRNIPVTMSEKIPPPMSVMGKSTSFGT